MTASAKVLDVLVYGLAVTVLVFALSVVIGWAVAGSWFGVEYAMFVIGWLMLGYGAFRMRPSAPPREETPPDESFESTPAFQRWLQRRPPLRSRPSIPEETLGPAPKLFVGGICVLAASIGLEVLLGVSPS